MSYKTYSAPELTKMEFAAESPLLGVSIPVGSGNVDLDDKTRGKEEDSGHAIWGAPMLIVAFFLGLAGLLIPMPAMADDGGTSSTDYPCNYSSTDLGTHTSRWPTSVTIGGTTVSWCSATGYPLYTDNTSTEITVSKGATVSVSFTLPQYTHWVNGYLYVDRGNDGQFSNDIDETTHGALATSDLVSWSYYKADGETVGYNSAGTSFDNGNQQAMPDFTAPTAVGSYRMRMIVTYNSIDPAGDVNDGETTFAEIGGAIMDLTLKVVDPLSGALSYAEVKDVDGNALDENALYYIVGGTTYNSGVWAWQEEATTSTDIAGYVRLANTGGLLTDQTNFLWKLTNDGGAVKIQNASTGNYLKLTKHDNAAKTLVSTSTATDAEGFYVREITSESKGPSVMGTRTWYGFQTTDFKTYINNFGSVSSNATKYPDYQYMGTWNSLDDIGTATYFVKAPESVKLTAAANFIGETTYTVNGKTASYGTTYYPTLPYTSFALDAGIVAASITVGTTAYTAETFLTLLQNSTSGVEGSVSGADLREGIYKIYHAHYSKNTILYNNGGTPARKAATNYSSTALSDHWILLPQSDGTFYIKAADTGLYFNLANGSSSTSSTAQALTISFAEVKNDVYDFTVSFVDGSTTYRMNAWAGDYTGTKSVGGWSGTSEANHWVIERVETPTKDDVLSALSGGTEFKDGAPKVGTYIRIRNVAYSGYEIAEGAEKNDLYCAKVTESASDGLNIWKVLAGDATGTYKLQNAVTGNYIVYLNSNSTQWTASSETTNTDFYLREISSSPYSGIFNIAINDSHGAHCTAAHLLCRWSTDAGGSRWTIAPSDLSEAELEAARVPYQEVREIVANTSTYQEVLYELFSDLACTQPKVAATDEEYLTKKAQLPNVLQQMCERIVEGSWTSYTSGVNWDKRFRIQQVEVQSNNEKMAWNVIGFTNQMAVLNSPMGIQLTKGEVVTICVGEDSEISSNAKLAAQIGESYSFGGDQVMQLQPGLNIFEATKDGPLFIYYMMTGSGPLDDDGENYKEWWLESFPDLTVNVSGGEVVGYLDLTADDKCMEVERDGATLRMGGDEVWATLQSDNLLSKEQGTMPINVKTPYLMVHVCRNEMLKGCPEKIVESMRIYDYILNAEQWAMGLRNDDGSIRDTYIPYLSKRWRGRWTSIDNTTGQLYATSFGVCMTGVSSNFNYDQLYNGNFWAHVHEHGHNHQKVWNLAGCTEISNNGLANIACYKYGKMVSRGCGVEASWSDETIQNSVAAKHHWHQYNLWARCQMYYKLFLYFDVAGHCPDFTPKLFDALRRDGFHYSSSAAWPASEDYLKFAKACATVSQTDLTEFFELYGFFRPLPNTNTKKNDTNGVERDCFTVGDYSNSYVYLDDTMISEVKEYMSTFETKAPGIIFIDDRTVEDLATQEGHAEGEMRTNRGDGGIVGAVGDVGMYHDFDVETGTTAGDYVCSYDAETGEVNIQGTGGVGYVVRDGDGNIIYIASSNSFTIPESLRTSVATIETYGGATGNVVEAEIDTDLDWTVIYRYRSELLDGAEIGQSTFSGVSGKVLVARAPADAAAESSFYTVDNVQTVSEDADAKTMTVTADLHESLPFTLSTDRLTSWTGLCIHSGKGYKLRYDATEGKADYVQNVSGTPSASSDYQWAVTGNVIDGFKFHNRTLGLGKAITNNSDIADDSGTGQYTYVKYADTNQAVAWRLYQSAQLGRGFYLGLPTPTDVKLNYRNSEGNLAFWTGGADAGSTLYTLDLTEYGNCNVNFHFADGTTEDYVYADATAPTLSANDICSVTSINGNADAAAVAWIDETANVVRPDGTMHSLSLTDKVDLHLPDNVQSAENVVYQRTNTGGFNSVCLPFATTAGDYGTDAQIYTVSTLNDNNGTYTVTLTEISEAAAGQPVFVYCPEDADDWNVPSAGTRTLAAAPVEPDEAASEGMVLRGAYVKGGIGAGKYKLAADGATFGVTTELGIVWPFRSYAEAAAPAAENVRAIQVVFQSGGEVTDVIALPADAIDGGALYDLQGRRIERPVRGQPYIQSGRVKVAR